MLYWGLKGKAESMSSINYQTSTWLFISSINKWWNKLRIRWLKEDNQQMEEDQEHQKLSTTNHTHRALYRIIKSLSQYPKIPPNMEKLLLIHKLKFLFVCLLVIWISFSNYQRTLKEHLSVWFLLLCLKIFG